jgi:hypothetical protein
MRLKPYHDPESRPTNPPEEITEDEELDPEEIPDIQEDHEADEIPNRQGARENNETENENQRKNKDTNNQRVRMNKTGNQDKQQRLPENTNKRPGAKENVNNNRQKAKDIRNTGNRNNGQPEGKNKSENKVPKKKDKMEKKKQGQHEPKTQNQKESENKPKADGKQKNRKEQKPQDNPESRKSESTQKKKVRFETNQSQNSSKSAADQNSNPKQRKIPKCKDCENNTCKPFRDDKVKSVISSSRSNGALYYRIKFQDNHTEWHFSCKVPERLIREFHANRTMLGKKRRKPLKKDHKYFKEQISVNTASTPSKSETKSNAKVKERLTGIKLIQGRAYFVKQVGSNEPELCHITAVHQQAGNLIEMFEEKMNEQCRKDEIEFLKQNCSKHGNESKTFSFDVKAKAAHELSIDENNNIQILIDYENYHLAPEWFSLETVPPGLAYDMIKLLKYQYKRFVRQ